MDYLRGVVYAPTAPQGYPSESGAHVCWGLLHFLIIEQVSPVMGLNETFGGHPFDASIITTNGLTAGAGLLSHSFIPVFSPVSYRLCQHVVHRDNEMQFCVLFEAVEGKLAMGPDVVAWGDAFDLGSDGDDKAFDGVAGHGVVRYEDASAHLFLLEEFFDADFLACWAEGGVDLTQS